MINSAEDLHNTFIDARDKNLVIKYINSCQLHGIKFPSSVSEFTYTSTCDVITALAVMEGRDGFILVDDEDFVGYDPRENFRKQGYKELTNSDFEVNQPSSLSNRLDKIECTLRDLQAQVNAIKNILSNDGK